MKIRTQLIWICCAAFCAAGFFTVRFAWRARHNLVTLNVRDMDVRKVVRKIEWQTWEKIYLSKDTRGKVTMNVRNAPLDTVLAMVSGQVAARSSHLFPIYRGSAAFTKLELLLQSDSRAMADAKQWTNFSMVSSGRGGPGFRGGFEDRSRETNSSINLRLDHKDPALAAVTLSASTGYQIVPEDGIPVTVTLDLTNATPKQAVKEFASALRRDWQSVYTIQPIRFNVAGRASEPSDQDVMRERMAARLEALPPEQRARMEQMRNLSPEERRARMETRMQDPTVQQRMTDRFLQDIRSSTPEQIVERKRQRRMMAQMFQGQRGQPPASRR